MMKILILLVSLFPFTDIGKINSAKSAAKKAFLKGDYKTAAGHYQYLVDSLGVREDEVILNLAHSRFNLNDTIPARQGYQELTGSNDPSIRATALQQLGVMSSRSGRLEEALDLFRSALKTNPANEEARFNYELVKRQLEEKKKQEQQQQQKDNKNDKNQNQKNQNDQQKKDQQEQQKKNEQQKKDQQQKSDQNKKDQQQQQQKNNEQQKNQDQKKQQDKLDPEKMKNMKISEDKARMILEAMKSNEVQYLQQNKRRATKPKDKSKPDW